MHPAQGQQGARAPEQQEHQGPPPGVAALPPPVREQRVQAGPHEGSGCDGDSGGGHARTRVVHGTCGWSDASLVRCGRFYPASMRASASSEEKLRHYSWCAARRRPRLRTPLRGCRRRSVARLGCGAAEARGHDLAVNVRASSHAPACCLSCPQALWVCGSGHLYLCHPPPRGHNQVRPAWLRGWLLSWAAFVGSPCSRQQMKPTVCPLA